MRDQGEVVNDSGGRDDGIGQFYFVLLANVSGFELDSLFQFDDPCIADEI